jgi:hypothetical protein
LEARPWSICISQSFKIEFILTTLASGWELVPHFWPFLLCLTGCGIGDTACGTMGSGGNHE